MISPLGRVVFRTQALRAAKPLAIRQFTSASPCLATSAVPATKRATAQAAVTTKAKPAAPKSASTTTKKAAATTTKKPAAKAAATKPAAKKPAAKKPVAEVEKKPRAKKLTSDQERLQLIKDLKEKALDPPTIRSVSSKWLTFIQDKFAPYKGQGKGVVVVFTENKDQWKAEFDALTPAQQQELQNRADKNKSVSALALQEWVSAHTPGQIHEANRARARLMKLKESTSPSPFGLKSVRFSEIPDDRFPKRPRTAPILWAMERMAGVATDAKVGTLMDCMKEFKNLPEAEQKKWLDAAAKDRVRYIKDLKTIGIEPTASYTPSAEKKVAAAKKTA
ncbi:hypothetical protein DFH27DRAFT_541229 [Peziza echinospora]|nr:hypothetical protein DFH27DRAFT_541229 [Peziza echinospora]